MMTLAVKLLSRHWPFANGSGRIIDRLGRGIDLGTGPQTGMTTDGFAMSVLADDLIGRHILISGGFHRAMIGVLLDFGEPGDQCVDIGANVGYVSCLMLQTIPGSHVLAIDPQPLITDLLRANLGHFPADRWAVVEAGLSDSKSSGFMHVDTLNRGASRLVAEHDGATVAVPLLPAAEVLGGLAKIDLIKIDVEGYEAVVLRAARDVIAARQPRAILFEDQKGQAGASGEIGSLLTQIGYRIFGLRNKLTATRLEPATDANAGSFNDFLAISTRREIPARAKARHGL